MKVILILFLTTASPVFGQHDSVGILLNKISQLQSKGDGFYQPGMFPTDRFQNQKNRLQDNTIFYTALVAYTLKYSRELMTPGQASKTDSIISGCIQPYSRYRSRNDELTFNFWQTHPDTPFPNDPKRSGKEKYRMPDDFDDTSIIYLTLPGNDSVNRVLKSKMIAHTNHYHKNVHGTFHRYRQFKAYNTWFGKNMPLDFDVSVMSNTMAYIHHTALPLNQYDSATLTLIRKAILSKDYLTHPVILSPYYQKPAVILYHVARLASLTHSPLQDLRPALINELLSLHKTKLSPMEQLIVATSLYRLGIRVDDHIDFDRLESDMKQFAYFAATPFGSKPMWIRKLVGKAGFKNFYYSCQGYYWTLVLENLVLKGQVDQND